jgi:cobalamin biosynthesis Co2+ chelatase CbiK
MTIETILKYLNPGDFVVLCIVLLWSWFLYKNFGKKIMQDYDNKINEIRKTMSLLQTKENCLLMQSGCQRLLIQKIEATQELLTERHDTILQKIDSVLDGQAKVMERLDKHINGGK